MPTRYQAILYHKPFDYPAAWREIRATLQRHRQEVLEAIGFVREYGSYETSSETKKAIFQQDSDEVLDDIASALTLAGGQLVATGLAPKNQMIANLKAVENDPELLWRVRNPIEPGTMRVLAESYNKDDDPASTLSQDLHRGTPNAAVAHQVSVAARTARQKLQTSPAKGRPAKLELRGLVGDLASIIRRFRDRKIGRSVSVTTGWLYGDVLDLLNHILPPLEAVCARYSRRPKFRIGREGLIKEIIADQKSKIAARSDRLSK